MPSSSLSPGVLRAKARAYTARCKSQGQQGREPVLLVAALWSPLCSLRARSFPELPGRICSTNPCSPTEPGRSSYSRLGHLFAHRGRSRAKATEAVSTRPHAPHACHHMPSHPVEEPENSCSHLAHLFALKARSRFRATGAASNPPTCMATPADPRSIEQSR